MRDKPRNGLQWEVQRMVKLFGVGKEVTDNLRSKYRQKYSPTIGTLYTKTVKWLNLPKNQYRLDGRSPDEFIYDICTGWIKEDLAIIKIASMLPGTFTCVLSGHDADRVIVIPEGKRPVSDCDFTIYSKLSNNKIGVQLKGTVAIKSYLRIKREDMDSGLYEDILFFNEELGQIHHLTRDEILSCEMAEDIEGVRPRECTAKPWGKVCYYVPKSLMVKKIVSLENFIESVVMRLS